jgi:hypothetical protein
LEADKTEEELVDSLSVCVGKGDDFCGGEEGTEDDTSTERRHPDNSKNTTSKRNKLPSTAFSDFSL